MKTGADGVLLASPAMIDLPLLNPRHDVIEHALDGEQEALDEAVHHLVPGSSPPARMASRPARTGR
ncbi:MAG: hypothetical protein R3C55_15120 [Parvularculaceae bacterium]